MSVNVLDFELCRNLSKLVEELTTSGEKELDVEKLKELKTICKTSDALVEEVYQMILHQLEKTHCEVRYSAFLLCDHLFRRSQCFRALLVSDFPLFLELTLETNLDKLLPPPHDVAKKLKRESMNAVQQWYHKYGEMYVKLTMGYNYLRKCKKFDFQDVEVRSVAERQRQKTEEQRMETIMKLRLKKVNDEVNESKPEISDILTQVDNCFNLLLPPPDQFNIDGREVTNEKDDTTEDVDFREHGVFNRVSHKIVLDIKSNSSAVSETHDNTDLIENIRGFRAIITNRLYPNVKKWIRRLTKISLNAGNSDLLKSLLDMKQSLENVLSKCEELNIPQKRKRTYSSNDTDSSDFEEVQPKEGYEEDVPEYLSSEVLSCQPSTSNYKTNNNIKTISTSLSSSQDEQCGSSGWSMIPDKDDEKDPTSFLSTVKQLNLDLPSTSAPGDNIQQSTRASTTDNNVTDRKELDDNITRKSALLAKAPKLPYDIDLYHWEDKELTVPSIGVSNLDCGHRFWQPISDVETILDPNGTASLRTRSIEFAGKFEPVKWVCRAPLNNGKLCPRMDRYKCPFHGVIIPRNSIGEASNPEDAKRLEKERREKKEKETPDWQDPQLLRDIQAATGVDLTIKKDKRKGRKPKYPGLTNLKEKQNTVRKRLEKKIFNRRAVNRVSAHLDIQDHKRFRDKFGDQWNYAYNTS